jgi:stringent starvation protein B
MQPTRLPRKKDVVLALLEQASVFVHVDPRIPDVRVPPWFKRQPQLVLQIGLNMPVPIPDLDVSDHGLSCTLSFNRSPFLCQIPWSSVFALVGESGRGMVWPDDVPPEVAAQAQKQEKPKLQSVPEAPGPEAEALAGTKPAARAKAKKPASISRGAKAGSKKKSSQPKTAPPKKKAAPKAAPVAAKAARPERAQPAPAIAQKVERASTQGAAGQQAAGAPGKKRDLPPYLRVVK